MKRYIPAVFLILTVLLFLTSVSRMSEPYALSGLSVSGTEWRELTDARAETDRELVASIHINGEPLLYDELSGSWFWSASADADVTDPRVGITPASEKVRVVFSGDLQPGKSIPMLAYTDTEFREYRLVTTTLPLVRIDCDDEQFIRTEFTEDTLLLPREKVPIRFTLIDNRPGVPRPVTAADGMIHMHGDSTLYYAKKGFRVSLYETDAGTASGREPNEFQAPLLGMRADGDWLLYPAYNDQEKIRNVFSSNLWFDSCAEDNAFGLVNGMEYRFIELFWNRQYWGLYALGYPVDAKQLDIQPDNQGHYDEFLFKQKAWGPKTKDGKEGYDGLIFQLDADESDLNNGISITKMYFSQLQNGAPGGLWHNDENNALDVWLYMKLIQAYDSVRLPGKMKNMMLAVKLTDEGRKILYTPWDMDITWGNIWEREYKNFTVPYALLPDDNSYELMVSPVHVMLEQGSSIRDRIKTRYSELRSDKWSDGTIDMMLDGFEKDIFGSGAYDRDMARWPDGTYQDPSLGLSRFRAYVHERFLSMDGYIENL